MLALLFVNAVEVPAPQVYLYLMVTEGATNNKYKQANKKLDKNIHSMFSMTLKNGQFCDNRSLTVLHIVTYYMQPH